MPTEEIKEYLDETGLRRFFSDIRAFFVRGVKGGRESSYRKGEVNLSLDNLALIDMNVPSTTTNDTQEFWKSQGTGYTIYNENGHLNGQPARYGFLINIVHWDEIKQFFIVYTGDGTVYHRGANSSTTSMPLTWNKAFDTKNLPTPSELGAMPVSGAFQKKTYQFTYTISASASLTITGSDLGVSTPSGYTPVAFSQVTSGHAEVVIRGMICSSIGSNGIVYLRNTSAASRTGTVTVEILYIKNS